MSALPAVSRPIDVQRRLVELGRIRLGQKAGGRGHPQKLETFRLTSASRSLLEAASTIYGGEVRDWADAPDPGYYQLTTTARELEVLIPPTLASYSQWYELWDGGGCVRRCDGQTERISDGPCLCDPDERAAGKSPNVCRITTRVSVMLPTLPGLGVWRLESHGWNAATTLPSTLELLSAAAQGGWVRAVLRAVQRSKRVRENGQVTTRRWIEPQLDVPQTMDQLMAVGPESLQPPAAIAAHADRRQKVPRPALPPGPEPPKATAFRPITAGPGHGMAPGAAGPEAGPGYAPSDVPGRPPALPAAARAGTPDLDPADPDPGKPMAAPPVCGALPPADSPLGMTAPCELSGDHRTHRSTEGSWPK